MASEAQYVIVWEFLVKPGSTAEFQEKYGPEGGWARFFRGSAGYIRTELVKDVGNVAEGGGFLRWITGRAKKSSAGFATKIWPSMSGWTKSLQV